MNHALQLRLAHINAQKKRLEALQDVVGSDPMGDYLCVGGQCAWLSEDEVFSVLDMLIKKHIETIKKLQYNDKIEQAQQKNALIDFDDELPE